MLYIVFLQKIQEAVLELCQKLLTFADVLNVVVVDRLWSIFHLLGFDCRAVLRMIKMFDGNLLFFTDLFEIVVIKVFFKLFFLHSLFVLFIHFEILLHLFEAFFENELVVLFRSFLRLVCESVFDCFLYLISVLVHNRDVFLVLSIYYGFKDHFLEI